jgi:hypothetical protein
MPACGGMTPRFGGSWVFSSLWRGSSLVQLELSSRWLHYGVVCVNSVALTIHSFSFYFSLSLFSPFSAISMSYTLQIRKEGCQFILMLNLVLIILIIIFSINLFFQFHHSILDWLGIKFQDFFFVFHKDFPILWPES